ncbi:MAG: hypothetical protein HKN68_14350, partial [Saprospiraceae bacterium]|nr:hypothetical protein [Saprospiraceae bacterium]
MKSIYITLILLLLSINSNAQNIGINTPTPHTSAALDIESINKGILIPRLKEAKRLSMLNPAVGLLVFEIESEAFWYYSAQGWVKLSSVGAFENYNGVVRNSGSVDDDFVFGMDSLPNNTTKYTENLFFFDEEKGAFRAGRLNNSKNWAADSIGYNSFAVGYNSKARGQSSVSIGYDNKAHAPYGIAIGFGNEAEGDFSTALGFGTDAESYAGVTIGRINVGGGDKENWVLTDPVFEVGIGTHSVTDRRNAMTILKNGKTGIGTATPDTNFTVVGVSRAALDESETDYIEMSHGGNNAFINKAGAGNIDIRHEDSNIMTLTSGKDVGIGTNSPDTKFSVIGKVRGAFESNENEYTEIYHGGGNGYINTTGDGNLDFRHDNDTKMSLTDVGDLLLDGQLTLGNANASQDYTFPGLDGNSAQILNTDGNGNVSWVNDDHHGSYYYGNSTIILGGNNTADDFAFSLDEIPIPNTSYSDEGFMFRGSRSSFRTGILDNSNNWQKSESGIASFGAGRNVIASGDYSAAFGNLTEANATNSFAAGENTNATGVKSASFGNNTTASGENAFAIGWTGNATGKTALKTGWNTFANGENSATFNQGTTANGLGSFVAGLLSTTHGNFSTAFGTGLQTNSYGTFAIGRYNEGIGSDLITWDESLTSIDEPVFEVGIGTLSTPKNAMTITKAGTVGVGTSSPTALFEIEFNDPNGPYDPNRAMYVESGGNAAFGIGG